MYLHALRVQPVGEGRGGCGGGCGGGGGGGRLIFISALYLYATAFAARFTTILSSRGSRDRTTSHLTYLYEYRRF